MLLQWTSQAVNVLAINGINVLLEVASHHMAEFEKHHTRSSEAQSLVHTLFLSQVGSGPSHNCW